MNARDRIIVALDTDSKEKCAELIDSLKDEIKYFKVGKELFTACGSEVLALIKAAGCQCFLDLKYHDIPNTVAKASRVALRQATFMFNVHASGGFKMMQEAALALKDEACKLGINKPFLIAVTVLTSWSEPELKNEIGITRSLKEQVLSFAKLAKAAGLDGVVSSANEIELIKENLGKDFLVVTPGIRPLWAAKGDQSRVVTPSDAIKRGADYLVIGRPITAVENPAEAAKKIIDEIESN